MYCCNFNVGFATKCEVQRPMRPTMCLGVKNIFINRGECKGWNLMIPKCIFILGLTLMWELRMFDGNMETSTKLGPSDTIKKVLKCRFLKCPCIVHLNQICMNYDFFLTGWCCNPSLGLTTKAKGLTRLGAKRKLGNYTTCSRECRKMWENEPSHSQGNSHFGKWGPGGLSNL
jgi:hypothetical protein